VMFLLVSLNFQTSPVRDPFLDAGYQIILVHVLAGTLLVNRLWIFLICWLTITLLGFCSHVCPATCKILSWFVGHKPPLKR
jgi:hypothetical protein